MIASTESLLKQNILLGVMPQLRAAERGTAECAEHAETLTYRLHPPGRVEGLPCARRARAAPFTAKKSRPPRGTGVPPVRIMGKMPMPRQVTTESFSSCSRRLRAFALTYFCVFPSPANAGFPAETEALLLGAAAVTWHTMAPRFMAPPRRA